jgi:hypothetical protein
LGYGGQDPYKERERERETVKISEYINMKFVSGLYVGIGNGLTTY